MALTNQMFKQFVGDLDGFKDYLNGLYTTDHDKWEEIQKSIVFIHENPVAYNASTGKLDANSVFDGWIFANGFYYTAKEAKGLDFDTLSAIIEGGKGVQVTAEGEGDERKLVFTAVTENEITTQKAVGYLNAGTPIPAGTSLEEVLKMIFNKVLGLSGAQAPTTSISGITTATKEVGDTYSGTVTATFNDGYWKNEESWTKSGIGPNQPYGCTATGYTFGGTITGTQNENVLTITDYVVKSGTQDVTCKSAYTASVNVPVKQDLTELESGTANDSTHYKPQAASTTSAATSSNITGEYYYFEGEVASQAAVEALDRAAVFAGTKNFESVSSQKTFSQFLYIAVPSNKTVEVYDAMGSAVVPETGKVTNVALGLSSQLYNIYYWNANGKESTYTKINVK